MLRVLLCCALVALLAACTSVTETPGTGGAEGEKAAAAGNVRIGTPVIHRNLTVFPLYLASYEEVDENYITLEDALEKKQVEVREVGGSEQSQTENAPGAIPQGNQAPVQQEVSEGTVNAVVIENKSDRPIYILAGQVIIGGKQDRVITKDTVVPRGEKLTVEVCCVEQGRWSPRESGVHKRIPFCDAASGNVAGKIKMMTQSGGQVSQSGVWEEVAKQAHALQGTSPTGTYKEVLEVTEKTIEEYIAAFKSFEKDGKICGFVVCINGEVESCDIFASPKLLALFREFQLRSYALDALNAGEAKDAKQATTADIREFMKEMEEAGKETEKLAENKHRRVDKMESEKVIGFDNAVQPAPGEACKSIHKNVYKKK